MPRIRCHYIDCGFNDEGYCSAAAVEFDPDEGCKTFSPSLENPNDDWDDVDDELEDWDDIDDTDSDDELWLDDDDNL